VGAKAAAAAPAGKAAKVYGPALEKAVRTFETTYLIVDCKDAGPGSTSSRGVAKGSGGPWGPGTSSSTARTPDQVLPLAGP